MNKKQIDSLNCMFFSATVVTADRSVVTFKGLLLTDTNKSMNDDDYDKIHTHRHVGLFLLHQNQGHGRSRRNRTGPRIMTV
jgi:hypothetical protein